MKLGTALFRAARVTRTAEAVLSGEPRRMARRAVNIGVGRVAARTGLWNKLWGGGR